jgi:hypothetical protein
VWRKSLRVRKLQTLRQFIYPAYLSVFDTSTLTQVLINH